ncbi:MAG: 2Fe-2S iron-sulfur cluster binding domain-containing protein [Bacteroidetes bacterium]|nr:2Fe-2S iron-sulfur cluster binding domain-containing protein [Bacteroidota bacterium]MCB9226465.1 2Fe-2S iron-sulfur cluster binding domain-containing protein [Chitinophagales bacterium]
MSIFHTLKVKTIQRQTSDAVAVSFEVAEDLKKSFEYTPGQYITFRVNVKGETYNRSYSLCSAPVLNEDLTVAVKQVLGGKVSTFINKELKEGDILEGMEPLGNFKAEIEKNDNTHFILFGGGSGITPLFSILKTALHKAEKTTVTLFYANYNTETVIFRNEIAAFQKQFEGRFKVIHIFDKPKKVGGFLGFGKKTDEQLPFVEGMLTKDKCLELLRTETNSNYVNAQFYMCGPGGFMDSVSAALNVLQIPKEKVHREYFTEKSEKDKEAAVVGNADDNFEGVSKVHITYDGKTTVIDVDTKDKILDRALDEDIDPPFACMVGACTTCRAKVIEGSIKMDDSDALTDKEIAAGYVLTCQSHPKSAVVKVSYDE